jgi:hypothetical protein
LGRRLVGLEIGGCRLERWVMRYWQPGEEANRSLVWIGVQDSMAASSVQERMASSSRCSVSSLEVASCVAQSPHSRPRLVHHHHLHSTTSTKKSSFPSSCSAFPLPARVRTSPRTAHPACSPACACHHASCAAPLSRSRCPRLQHRVSEPAYPHYSSSPECTGSFWSVQAGSCLVPRCSLPVPCDRGSNSWLPRQFHHCLLRLRQGRFCGRGLGDMGGRSW